MRQAPVRVEQHPTRRQPRADKLATECVVNLIRTESLVAAELDRIFRAHGLTGPGYNVLLILAGAGTPLPPYVIGERLLVTRGTVTGLLDSLEKRDLVRRIPHPQDRRMLLVELTGNARPLMRKVARQLLPAQAEMISTLSEQEKETLIGLLGQLQNHLQSRPGVPPTTG
jgi:DNA-binding MarR family transcriptional regulator